MSRTLIIIGLAIAAVDQLSYRLDHIEKIVLKQTCKRFGPGFHSRIDAPCTAVDFGRMFTRKTTLRRHARSVQG